MKNLDSGTEKVKKICEAIKRETIEPALEEANHILTVARDDAVKMIEDARKKSENLLQSAREQMAKEKHVFAASLNQASQQAIETLRQELEKRFFHPEIAKVTQSATQGPEVIARFIDAILIGIKKEGMEADFSVIVPQHVTPEEIALHVVGEGLKQFIAGHVERGPLKGGVQIRFKEDNLTIDISDKTLVEFLAEYIRKDLREILFRSG